MPIEYDNNQYKKKKQLTPKAALLKAADFCAYQERSQHEIRKKFQGHGLTSDEIEELIYELIVQGFLNEERFAIAYAGGKFRVKCWGKTKIIQGLKQHKISDYCIKKALETIPNQAYLDQLEGLIEKKRRSIKEGNTFEINQKLARYAQSRGYEATLIWEILQ